MERIEVNKGTLIKFNKKFQKQQEDIKRLSEKVKEQKKIAKIHHDREDLLKCEILKLNPKHKFDNSEKYLKKNKIRNRDNNLCCFCKRNIYEVSQESTLHHKVPKRYGGSDKLNNLITICQDCHNLLEELIGIVEESVIKFTKGKLNETESKC